MKLLFTICALLMLESVQAQPLIIEFKNGKVDHFNSDTRLLTRRMCGQDDQQAKVSFGKKQRALIEEAVKNINFFDLPANQTEQRTYERDGEVITVTSHPCPTYSLRIQSGAQTHQVYWNCASGRDDAPEPINPLVDLLRKFIYSKRAVKILEPTDCGFI